MNMPSTLHKVDLFRGTTCSSKVTLRTAILKETILANTEMIVGGTATPCATVGMEVMAILVVIGVTMKHKRTAAVQHMRAKALQAAMDTAVGATKDMAILSMDQIAMQKLVDTATRGMVARAIKAMAHLAIMAMVRMAIRAMADVAIKDTGAHTRLSSVLILAWVQVSWLLHASEHPLCPDQMDSLGNKELESCCDSHHRET